MRDRAICELPSLITPTPRFRRGCGHPDRNLLHGMVTTAENTKNTENQNRKTA